MSDIRVECYRCGEWMEPVWFTEFEEKVQFGLRYKTGRKRRAVFHFICPNCLSTECVDDSFDEPWQ